MKFALIATSLTLGLIFAAPTVHAYGGSEDVTSTTQTKPKACKKGKIWNKRKNRCVKKSSELDHTINFGAKRQMV